MKPAASAQHAAERIVSHFTAHDDGWQDFGQARSREAAEACALSMNESPSRISWEYRVFPIGTKWVVRRAARR